MTGAFARWVAGYTEKRQHERWQRTQRHAAYTDYLREVDRTMLLASVKMTPKTKDQMLVAITPMAEVISTISILGPEAVIRRADALRTQVATTISEKRKSEGFEAARVEYVVAVREALGIDPETDETVMRSTSGATK
ncbi:hypothetical protein [Pseudolysinimonas yzui]|uniref:Uncharacterized protein n=1 Tax=Pseudolysinimonas yzui TaxID=2708254 RepID=A0A8J3GN97_9MICO|nr:hypothetical protein [Pseudolysinimonas yzui]GHF06552.1 hypothetical protein GCM10011600_03950 [Pseudolysinimonas yzui]